MKLLFIIPRYIFFRGMPRSTEKQRKKITYRSKRRDGEDGEI